MEHQVYQTAIYLRLSRDDEGDGECAKNGKINCIVVKDFSRLGRNFQKTEKYMQRIFPKMGIRFISVMDCYDTGRQLTASERLTAPLINLEAEW